MQSQKNNQGSGETGIELAHPSEQSEHNREAARSARQLRRMFRRASGRFRSDTGAATAEYAVATMAAVGFAGLLIIILRGDEVRAILTDLVRNALTVG
ncbi:hypothetical protein GCM10022381_17990 [Leifsonia kafniensis]|uniref:DUF4244 domain-containing protein n=2 Tax=Leifsonia kafniensis TaxID=475957 RepID=A0ABP7KF83_9MICO